MSSDISTNDPDAIRADIERTRAGLSQDVNALGEAVSPGNLARHQVNKVGEAAGSLKERVMGSTHDATDSVGNAASDLGDRASHVTRAAKGGTRGNPLAAGVIALGAGWLLGSLLPATDRERDAAVAVKEKAQPVLEEAQSVAQESAERLKQPAMESVTAVKETAQSAVETVKDEGQSAAHDVKGSAVDATQAVQDQGGGSGGDQASTDAAAEGRVERW
jgi:ElaB/YqjD/DUF883 family membrane-anchored ribosome-binding protein